MNSAATLAASHTHATRTHASRAGHALIANSAAQGGPAASADTPDFSTLLQEDQTSSAKVARATAAESSASSTSPKRTNPSDLVETAQGQVVPPQPPQTQSPQAQSAQGQASQAPESVTPDSTANASAPQASNDPANAAQLNPQATPSAQGLADSSGLQASLSPFTPANDVAQNPPTRDPSLTAKGTSAAPAQSPVTSPALTGLAIDADADSDLTPDTLAADRAAAGQVPTSSPGATSPSTPASASSSPKSTKGSEATTGYLASLSGPKADLQASHTDLSTAVAAVPPGDQGAGGGKNGGPANQEGGAAPDGSAPATGTAPDTTPQGPDPSAVLIQPQFAPETPPLAPSATATPQTVNALAAQIVQKLDGAATRFQLTLNPEGLGKVDVAIEITAKGAVSATLSFQHAESTAVLSRHADALRQALADAGLSLNPEDLSFQTASGGADTHGGQFEQASQGQTGNPHAGLAAMSRASDAVETAPATAWTASRSAGLNILI